MIYEEKPWPDDTDERFLLYRKFKTFCLYANQNAKHMHPADRDRWLNFVYATVEAGIIIDLLFLKKELMKFGWSEERATQLMHDYNEHSYIIDYTLDRLK